MSDSAVPNKLREDGLFTSGRAKYDTHFIRIKFDENMKNDGVDFKRSINFIQVDVNPTDGDELVVGSNTYTYRDTPTLTTEILIGTASGAEKEETLANTIVRINLDRVACKCTAYPLGDLLRAVLVEDVFEEEPTFECDDDDLVASGWVVTLAQVDVEDEDTFLIPLTDGSSKPVILSERGSDWHNFLY
jgi:hypothetical protein